MWLSAQMGAQVENTKSSHGISLYISYGMVHHALLVFDVSGADFRGFHAIRPVVGVFSLEWLVHANDLTNFSGQHELPVCKVFSWFSRASYGKQFSDRPGTDKFTTLSSGVFWWSINICPWHLIFRQSNICTIKQYFPSQFDLQIRYD